MLIVDYLSIFQNKSYEFPAEFQFQACENMEFQNKSYGEFYL